jgi:putative phosphoesterase
MRLIVIADTHIPDFARTLPRRLLPALRRAELILHAGDVTSPGVLDELTRFAPVHVAAGNNDGPDVRAWGADDEVHLDVEGVRIVMLHDAGRRSGREQRLRRRYPEADLVVFGHSHIPVNHRHDGMRLFNPGSPTWKRREPVPTYGSISIAGGRMGARVVPLEG